MNKLKTKVGRNTFMINGETEEDNKKREIVKSILINEENKNKSDLHNYFLNNRNEAIFIYSSKYGFKSVGILKA